MNWKQLKKELQDTFGKDGFKYFNDKNKYTRRIKIWGTNKYKVHEYLQSRYPSLIMWETTGGVYDGYFSGICFNLNHQDSKSSILIFQMLKKDSTMVQDYLVMWIQWYYGDAPYPNEIQNKMTWDEKIEAIRKTNEIKEILGRG